MGTTPMPETKNSGLVLTKNDACSSMVELLAFEEVMRAKHLLVAGSNPVRHREWSLSSIGRASVLQIEGCRFKSCRDHHLMEGVAKWLNAADCKSALY